MTALAALASSLSRLRNSTLPLVFTLRMTANVISLVSASTASREPWAPLSRSSRNLFQAAEMDLTSATISLLLMIWSMVCTFHFVWLLFILYYNMLFEFVNRSFEKFYSVLSSFRIRFPVLTGCSP